MEKHRRPRGDVDNPGGDAVTPVKIIEPNIGTLGARCRRLFSKCNLSTDDHWEAQINFIYAIDDAVGVSSWGTMMAIEVTL